MQNIEHRNVVGLGSKGIVFDKVCHRSCAIQVFFMSSQSTIG